MASMIKTAAVTVAMSKCPFLSNEVLAFALKSTKLYSTFARKCPVMGQLLTKGVATLPVTEGSAGNSENRLKVKVSPTLTNMDKPTQIKPAQALPPNYGELLKGKISTKKNDSTYREFRVLSRSASNAPYAVASTSSVETEDVSVWCSNDYLGMSNHPRVSSAVVEAIKSNGVGAGGTRNIAGTSHHHVNLENTLAALHGKQSALVFTSCYVANDTTLQTLARQLSADIYSDAGNHASMIAGIQNSRAPKYIFRHNDVDHLEELLSQSDSTRNKIVAFESVYSMTGTMAPLERLCDVAHKHNAITFVDEVHAVGLYGYHGAGLAEELGIAHKTDIVSGTLGKAFGLMGGYIASTGDLVDVVRSYGSGLIFTTSIPPSIAAGAVESVQVLAGPHGRDLRLRHRAAYSQLRDSLLDEGFPVMDCPSHIVPVHIGNAQKAKLCMEMLFDKHKIYVQAINYPTVRRGSELLRFVATPYHTPELLEHLLHSLNHVWDALDLPKTFKQFC